MENFHLRITNKTDQLEKVQAFVEKAAESWSLKPELLFELNLILEEYLTNLINYGYSDNADHFIDLEISLQQTEIRLLITDDAGPFNITEVNENEQIDKPLDQRNIGGLGIHLIKEMADRLEYTSKDGANRLLVVKYLHSDS